MHTHNDYREAPRANVWRDRLLTAGAAIVIGLSLSNVAPADELSRDEKRAAEKRHDAVERQAKADYKAARERCKELSGNDKDVCIKEAKAARKQALADAKAAEKSADAKAEAREEKRDAREDVAEEKCESMTGNAKERCEKRAEANH